MRVSAPPWPYFGAAAGLACVLGALISQEPQLAVLVVACVLGLSAFSAPTAAWVAVAVVSAATARGLVTVGVLPSIGTFLDMPLAWGALAVALLRQSGIGPSERRVLGLLTALGVVIAVSAAFDHSELARPVVFYALLGQPLALIAALVIDPPSPRQRHHLEMVLVGILAVQIPIAYIQFAKAGTPGDSVQGTLTGAGAGHHVMSGIVAVGAIWLATRRPIGRYLSILLAALLIPIPFMADAKQVIFALPAILLILRWRDLPQAVVRTAAVIGAIAALVLFFPAGRTAVGFLDSAEQDRGGKGTTFALVWNASRHDPVSVLVGQGPAETVTRSAYMTTDLLLRSGSPLRALGLAPASLAEDAWSASVSASTHSGGGTSFNTGLSSMIGVLGDIGVLGLGVYVLFWLTCVQLLLRHARPNVDAALSGIAILGVLGFVFDWWEQPPFTVFVATLVGLGLTSPIVGRTAKTDRTESMRPEAPCEPAWR